MLGAHSRTHADLTRMTASELEDEVLGSADVIAREAGALVGWLDGRPAGPELVVAAGPGLYERLQELLLPLRPDRDGPDG